MKKILIILSAAMLMLCSCEDRVKVLFDTPFVSITDESGSSCTMDIDNSVKSTLATLNIRVCASDNYFKEAITVTYEVIVGDGLTEGVDFRLQQSTSSPVTFEKGTYNMPVRLMWYANPSLDKSKDCTLKIKLTGSSIDDMVIGYPGPDKLNSTFTFTKK